nr:PREDICTED: ovalbumin-related protein X-like [Megachile rotundata]XP_012147560.1 PREDICTED: ovalbumin-related protein X-like [Megachile rotundata]
MLLSKGFGVYLALIAMASAQNESQALCAVQQSVNQFSSALFPTVAEDISGDFVLSPLSVSTVLAEAAYGSGGDTKTQFKNVLHLLSPDSLGTPGYQAFIDDLNNVQENKLFLSTNVFIDEKFVVKRNYRSLIENYFRSVLKSVKFAESEETLSTVNAWVQRNTDNRIRDIADPSGFDAKTAMLLLNVVHSKGQWENKFNPEYTNEMLFELDEDTEKFVSMMYRSGVYTCGELPSREGKFVVIPYKGNELDMVIVLPDKLSSLSAIEKELQSINITDIIKLGQERPVQLYLPKFRTKTTVHLNGPLHKLGLTDMFTSRANFYGLSDDQLAVSRVVQKTFIDVNEEGVEAVSVTGTAQAILSSASHMNFSVNRPFYYNIIKTTKRTGSSVTLFSGHVTEPIT